MHCGNLPVYPVRHEHSPALTKYDFSACAFQCDVSKGEVTGRGCDAKHPCRSRVHPGLMPRAEGFTPRVRPLAHNDYD